MTEPKQAHAFSNGADLRAVPEIIRRLIANAEREDELLQQLFVAAESGDLDAVRSLGRQIAGPHTKKEN